MVTMQCVGFADYEGVGKTSGRPYKQRTVKGVFTQNGEVEVGEVAFFDHPKSPLPKVESGKNYQVIFAVTRNQRGSLAGKIIGFKPAA